MKLLICVAFHFKKERLIYLKKILESHQFLAEFTEVKILTNTTDSYELKLIQDILPSCTLNFTIEIISFVNLYHPWVLTWAHKSVMAKYIVNDSFTHFMYTEDDLEVTPQNIKHWIANREILRETGLYPSFLRVEWNEYLRAWTSTDLTNKVKIEDSPRVTLGNKAYEYLNLPNPYQAMFFYDKELMLEHFNSYTYDVNSYGQIEKIKLNEAWGGGVAERANYALTFEKVPHGFTSRNVVQYSSKYNLFNYDSFVHHLPNNYANQMPGLLHGKYPVNNILE